ncbi:MAG: sulfate permease [Leucobacter sp.]
MIRQLWTLSVYTRAFLRRYMPTNILLDLIRTRRGLKWGIPAAFLAVPYLLAASICTSLIANGGPGWLNLLVLLFLWNSMKFIVMGSVSLVLLVRARTREALAKRRTLRSDEPLHPAEHVMAEVAR